MSINTPPDLGTWNLGLVDRWLGQSGGDGVNYVWTLISGALPPGIALRTDFMPSAGPHTGSAAYLGGVATQPGTFNFTLQVSSGGSTATRAFTVIVASLTSLEYALPDAYAGIPYSYRLAATGNIGAPTFELDTMQTNPSWVTLMPDGTLGGVPPTPAGLTYAYIYYKIRDSVTTVQRYAYFRLSTLRFLTNPALPNAAEGALYNVTLKAAGGTPPYTFSASNLPSGMTLSADGVLSASSVNSSGSYNSFISVSDSSGAYYYLYFQLNVKSSWVSPPSLCCADVVDWAIGYANSYTFSPYSGTAPYRFSATGLPPGIFVRTASSLRNQGFEGALELYGAALAAGEFPVVLTLTDSSTPPITTSLAFTLRVPRITLQTDYAPMTRGAYYTGRVRVMGGTPPYGPLTVVDGKLPSGIVLDPNTGLVSGFPYEDGYVNVTYSASDSASVPNRTRWGVGFSINNPTGPARIYNYYSLGDFSIGSSLTRQLSPTNLMWSVEGYTPPGSAYSTGIPTGMTLSSSGRVSGTPSVPGLYRFLVRATDPGNPSSYSIKELEINVTPLRWYGSNSYSSISGVPLNIPLNISGPIGVVTWEPAFYYGLPPGLSLNGQSLSGTPSSAGYYYVPLVARDLLGRSAKIWLYLTIYPANTTLLWNFRMVSVQPSNGAWPFVTYQADVFSTTRAFDALYATLATNDPNAIRPVPGKDTLRFAPVAAGMQISSTNLFTVMTDPSMPLDTTKLSWNLTTTPAKPVANAGGNQTVSVGATVNLNGALSANPSGIGALDYAWSFASRPVGTGTRLFYSTGPTTTFVADVAGTYVVTLKVSNGVDTASTNVTITAVP